MIKSENYITAEVRKAAEKEALAHLLNIFAETMFNKIVEKLDAGYIGWDQKTSERIESLKRQLADNINAGDWIDVANISMLLWNLQQPDQKQ